ncbi:9711_t:CDS:10, partial [Gigaspora margarita]
DVNAQNEYTNSMSQHIQTIFNATTSYFPLLISSCLRICYEIPDIKIDPLAIWKASEISSTESMGIMLIEQYLTLFPTQRELAHLYKSIVSSDVYKSIYENYIAHHKYTKGKHALNDVTFWEEGRLECFEKLSKWDDLAETVHLDIDSNLEKLWDQDFQIVEMEEYPSKRLDPSNSWDDIITSRHSLLGAMTNLLQGDMHVNYFCSHMSVRLEDYFYSTRLQGNFEVARVCLNKARQSKLHDTNELDYHQLKLNLQEALTAGNPEKKLSILLVMMDEFKKVQMKDIETQMKNRVTESETYATLAAVLDNDENRDISRSLQHRKAHFIVEGYNLLKDTAEQAALHLKPISRAKIFVKFAKFCDYYLRNLESTDGDQKEVSFDSEQYASTFVQYVLKAMEECSKEASETFPRLLQIISIYDNAQSTFKQMVSSFSPTWKFIRWIPQIVDILDKPIAQCVFPILYNLAGQYPKSLNYPLKISKSEINKSRVQNLKQMTKCEIANTLISELQRLTDSEIHFASWSLIRSKTATNNQDEEIKESSQRMKSFLLDVQNPRINGSKLARFLQSEFKEKICDYYVKNIKRGDKKPPSATNLLKSYSKWLADFSSSNCDEVLQYDGLGIPDPSRHIKIAYFDPKVLVLRSLRKPKRIVIIGTDGKEYPFLVKGGEDLRLDQRVQQLFTVMNELMRKDYFCSQRKIELITYKIVPITGSLGIIEWINDTRPLRSFIENEASDASNIENTQNDKLNRNLLKTALYKLAASPEAHLAIRNEFIKNLAAINICGYLIGSLVSIDFGHAFGSATETLEVPELVPFRLTKQFESIMEPLGSRGLWKQGIKHDIKKSSQTSEWYPRQKLDIVRRKLEGENPAYIVCEELAFGHSKKSFIEGVQKIARGDREHNIRADVSQKCGSIKEQVGCLIDLATDPVILGIMYVGWMGWL